MLESDYDHKAGVCCSHLIESSTKGRLYPQSIDKLPTATAACCLCQVRSSLPHWLVVYFYWFSNCLELRINKYVSIISADPSMALECF